MKGMGRHQSARMLKDKLIPPPELNRSDTIGYLDEIAEMSNKEFELNHGWIRKVSRSARIHLLTSIPQKEQLKQQIPTEPCCLVGRCQECDQIPEDE